MAITIQLRRGTAAEWTSANPVLALAESGIETDTNKFKFGDGSTAWNSLDYVATGTTGTSVRCGDATLSSGTATVSDSEVTENSKIVVTPQAAPGTPGTVLYVDPANIVPSTSFDITSDDATDARSVFWIASEWNVLPPLNLPATFYVAFRARFSGDEMTADDPSPMFEIGDIGTTNSIFVLANVNSGTQWTELFIRLDGGSLTYDLTGLELQPATYYTFDLKFEFAVDFSTCDVTPRIDGTPLVEGAASASTAMSTITSLALGATRGAARTDKKDFDWLTIGTGTWGDSDILDAQFSGTAPFDSLQGSGASVSAGLLSIDKTASPPTYALKACTT